MQPHHRNRDDESQFLHSIGNALTGGTYGIVRWVFDILANVNNMLLAVFLRKNMGYKITKTGSWIFASAWLTLLFFISIFGAETDPVTGLVIDETYSAPLLALHGFLFFIFSRWRRYGAWRNLRNTGKPGVKKRHSLSIGESVLYPLIRWVLNPLGLIDREGSPKHFWKLNHDRWVQYLEPALLGLTGYVISSSGYEVYGNMIMIATVCLFINTFRAYNNSAKIRQAQTESVITGEMLEKEPVHEDQPYIIQ